MAQRKPTQETGIEIGEGGQTELPQIGLGTYKTGGYECYNTVKEALDTGYRHIDTAMAYENEAAVGRAIETSDVDREDVFLTTKIKGYPEFVERDRLLEAADGCLERLDTEYIDLLLVHWWNSRSNMMETFQAMAELVEAGKVRHIGVSNFSIDRLRRAMHVSDVPILTNQVEHHPYWKQNELLEFCQANDVILTAYSPLAEGLLVDDQRLAEIGNRHGKTPAQVAIRWLIQQENVVTIPKTTTPEYLRQNIDIWDFELTSQEMSRIDDLQGPFLYRHNREGGLIHQARGVAGPIGERIMPNKILNKILS